MVAYVPLFICLQNMPYVDSLTYVELYGRSGREKEEPEDKKERRREDMKGKTNPCEFGS